MGIFSSLFGDDAEDAAHEAAKQNQIAIAAETAEQVRRLEYNQAETLGETEANIRASGFRGTGGSSTGYLDEMAKVFEAEKAWLKKSGQYRALGAKLAGDVAESQARAAQASNIISTALSVASLSVGIAAL